MFQVAAADTTKSASEPFIIQLMRPPPKSLATTKGTMPVAGANIRAQITPATAGESA